MGIHEPDPLWLRHWLYITIKRLLLYVFVSHIIPVIESTFICGYVGCGKSFKLRTSVNHHQVREHGREKMMRGRPGTPSAPQGYEDF